MAGENGAPLEGVTPEQTGNVDIPSQVDDGATPEKTPESTQPESPKWMGQLPDKLKGNESLSKYNSLGEALEALLDGSKKPAKEPEPGQEETPVEYKFSRDLNKEVDPSGTIHENIVGTLKQLKVPQEQADAIYSALADSHKKIEQDIRAKGAETCEASLKESWGDKYAANMEYVKRAYSHLVPKGSDLETGLKQTMAENNPFVVQLLATIGQSVAEHNPPRSAAVGAEIERRGFLTRENERYPWEDKR